MRAPLVMVVALLSCTGSKRDLAAKQELRDAARLVLEAHCGECHIGSYPTALPRALEVYDLAEPEWARRMTDAQLSELAQRIGQGGAFFDEFDVRNKGKTPPPPPTPGEQQIVRDYVKAEVDARKDSAR